MNLEINKLENICFFLIFCTFYIKAIQEGLAKLIKIVINMETLQEALSNDGTPTTLIEIQKRFISYLNELTQGKELSRVRILLE